MFFYFTHFLCIYFNYQTDKRTDYPGKRNSNKVQKKWDLEFNLPINVVLGDEWNAGNLSYHLKSRPIWEGELNKKNLIVIICLFV